ncbi:MAG: DUF2815 family protein [Gemmatimonadota bacterium]|nr:DUF2815 family protein [Gemmatimonadota bacterium]
MTEVNTKDATLVITPKATLSFPHIAKAQPGLKADDKPKFSGVFVFAPGTDLKPLYEAAAAAANAKWPGKAPAMVTTGGKNSTFRNDVVDPASGKRKYVDGSIYISARSEQKPGTVYLHAGPDGKKPAVIPAEKITEELYAGAQVRVQLRAFAYDKGVNKGIGWALNNIQKLGDGPRLDSRQAADEAFDADLNATPAGLEELVG